MDHRAAELLHPLERIGHGRFDLEVRQGTGIAWPGPARVDAEPGRTTRLPPLPLLGTARIELDPEKARPELASTSGIVGRELDQNERHSCGRYSCNGFPRLPSLAQSTFPSAVRAPACPHAWVSAARAVGKEFVLEDKPRDVTPEILSRYLVDAGVVSVVDAAHAGLFGRL
jgi:hypothetical protein